MELSSASGLWKKYMGKDEGSEETNTEPVKSPAVVATPAQTKTDSAQAVASPEYQMLHDAVWIRASALNSLIKTVDSLKGIIPDESQRLMAAVKALESTSGFSATQLSQAIVMHLGLLDSAKKKFEKDIAEQLESSVGSLETENANISGTIAQKEQEIARLTQEITDAKVRQNAISGNILQSKEKINSVAKSFAAAAELIERELVTYQQRLKGIK